MSNSFDKKKSSLAFSLQKTYEKILNFKPSFFIIGLLAVAASIFLFAGGIYNLLMKPIVAIVAGGSIISFYPYGITEQLLLESILVMIFYTLGFAGLLISYRSTKHASNPREAYRFLLVGVVLFVIAYILLEVNLFA
ncbi:MAG: hypothetical protein IAX21_05370 [Candidatus Bathyarchaeota archaeon]|nr:hypothetical protein [Candidatus Bathyarchaeum tardum]WGM89623.1 MAG: hypothetical protein NUK63_00415 [Candidatus Bathyarchaeum tardum]WNZ30275.1 MAG: hypothetical protein IAX21_05370 [Candidatus Bathyarchaeota archaeon]